MTQKNTPDVGWLFGKLYICETEEQLKKIANIGNICKNIDKKIFYHSFLLQKYEAIKDNPDYKREPFSNFERDIGPYAHRAYIRSCLHKESEQDPELLKFISQLAENQYHS